MKRINLKSWLSEVDDRRELFALNLAGTHDCVTRYVQFSHISKCQDMSIYEQLCIGIRALDIRVCSLGGSRLGMVHGIAKAFNKPNHFSAQMEMSDVLDMCYRFLDENSSEAIVFQFKNDSCKEQEKCFDIMYNNYILPSIDRWYLKDESPLLSDVRGKIVLLRRCNMDEGRYGGADTGIDFSSWCEQDEITTQALTLNTGAKSNMNFIIQDRYKYRPEPRWRKVIKPFLDSMTEFDGTYVINYLSTAGGLKGPYNNSRYINPRFMDYRLDSSLYYGTIYMDFPTEELVEKTVITNL